MSNSEYSLKVGVRDSDYGIWNFESRTVSIGDIENRWRDIVKKINESNEDSLTRGLNYDALDDLKRVGRDLCEKFLTPDVREKLITTHVRYLILEIDANLVHLPWELLYINGRFLCERFCMGRIPSTTQKIPQYERRDLAKPFDMWILADPRGDLPAAGSEGDILCEYMDKINMEDPLVYADLSTEITLERVREKIKEYDFVHFAGHAEYDSQAPGQSGWRLTDGNFTANDVHDLAVGKAMPALVFSNACQSASTEKWAGEDGTFGLANAFMLAGTKHYIGTSWKVKDHPSSDFARIFYEYLVSGKTVGDSVRLARHQLIEHKSADSSWAGYVLYGEPGTSYFGETQDKNWIKLQITTLGPVIQDVPREETGPVLPPPIISPDEKKRSRFGLKHYIAGPVILVGLLVGYYTYPLWGRPGPDTKIECPTLEPEVIKTFEQINRKKKERIDHLWNEYLKITGTVVEPVETDEWTSAPLTMACVYDSHNPYLGLITNAIGSQIIHGKTSFTLLSRTSFDKYLEELNRGIQRHQLRGRLKMPAHLLFIQINQCESQPIVLMELVETETGQSLDFFDEILEQGKPVRAQKQRLGVNLLKTLEKIADNPLRGKISRGADESITLNIGSDHGIKFGQHFQVIDTDIILEIRSIKDQESTAKITHGDIPLEQGWKIEEKM